MTNRKGTDACQGWDHYQVSMGPSWLWDRLEESTSPFVVDALERGRQRGFLTEEQFHAIVQLVAIPRNDGYGSLGPSIADEAEVWLASLS